MFTQDLATIFAAQTFFLGICNGSGDVFGEYSEVEAALLFPVWIIRESVLAAAVATAVRQSVVVHMVSATIAA